MSTGANDVPGFHFLQTPGPSNVPGRVLRAMSAPTIDHRGPEFEQLSHALQGKLRELFGTEQPVVMYSGSGTGGWEAAMLNTLTPGARVLAFDTGHFARAWAAAATRLGFDVTLLEGDWATGVDPDVVTSALAADAAHSFAATLIVHGETSTGVLADLPACRAAIDAAQHPCLLLVDVVSSLGCSEYRHDAWGVDVAVCASQKGLMLPPGLAFNAVSSKALAAAASGGSPRSFWDWEPVIAANAQGVFPSTPPTNLMLGMVEALSMLDEEGMQAVLARHRRHAAATRATVAAWGLQTFCQAPDRHHPGLTAVRLPSELDERRVRSTILEAYGVSLGAGLGPLAGSVFRIGHLGDFNDAMLIGVLGAIELGLRQVGLDCSGGVAAALDSLR
jgi:alanine-glyoxylate transaminase/serine-glyoxylate transaminase/serine-pyruvate transaminase